MRKLLLGFGVALLSGCALGVGQPSHESSQQAVDLVLELYAYAEILRQSDRNGGAWRYPGDINELLDCREPRQALRVATQLGAAEAEPSSRGQARQVYEACLARYREPLLRGYIQQQLAALEEAEQLQTELRGLRQTLSKKKQQGAALQEKYTALEAETKQQEAKQQEAKQQEAKQQENSQSAEAAPPQDENSQSRVRELEEQVRTLEAQLQSLTSIEQELNQEEQQATP